MTEVRRNFLERDRVRQEALGAVNEELAMRDGTPPSISIKSTSGKDAAELPIRGGYSTLSHYLQ